MNTSNKSLDNLLTILELVSCHPQGIALADIVHETDIPKTTAYRILNTLKARNFVELDHTTEKYTIGIKTIEIGIKNMLTTDFVNLSIPFLRKLSDKIEETAFLAVYNNKEIVYLYKEEPENAIRTTSTLGSRRPAYCTGLGRAILAHLPEEEVEWNLTGGLKKYTPNTETEPSKIKKILEQVRENGYSYDNEEVEDGVSCLATPIFNHLGNVIAAISVAGPTLRIKEQKDEIIPILLETGKSISQRLGYFGQKIDCFQK